MTTMKPLLSESHFLKEVFPDSPAAFTGSSTYPLRYLTTVLVRQLLVQSVAGLLLESKFHVGRDRACLCCFSSMLQGTLYTAVTQ